MQLSPRRLFFGTSTALVLAAFFAASVIAKRAVVTGSARTQAAAAAARLERSLEGRDDTTRALALAYLERARLGLGSPFRLVEQATRDPRLADSLRRDVAWALVDRIFEGRIYEIDGAALDAVAQEGTGAAHLAVIEEAILEADDPRTAEAAVRIAYALAASSGTTGISSLPLVAEAAAQIRDRVLAQRDLRDAVALARRDGIGVIEEIIRLRAGHQLGVERPLLGALSADGREDAIDDAEDLLRRIDAVIPGEGSAVSASLLDRSATLALASVSTRLPPIAAVRVPVTGRAMTLRADTALARSALAVIGSAANEESLVAAFSYADRASEGRSGSLKRLMLTTGVALRAHAQDRIWFPGTATASAGSVIGRFGLEAITFDRDVPREWRPYYVQTIATALDDFQRALPGYDPVGLSFRIETGSLPDAALAMHDPRTHTIRLSAMTPTGTLAHELAHDVDWRAARRLFAKAGGYATDRSVREQSMRLASSVRGLTSARAAGLGRISPHGSSRPAEVFARSVDWYVADALAAMGRSNGALSAIEDPVLTGFAAIPTDAPALDGARALVGTLTEMTWLPDSVSRGFVARWSSLDRLDPSTLVMRTIDAPVTGRRGTRIPAGLTREMVNDLAAGALCRVDAMRQGSAQDRLLAMAIDARARGIVARRTRYAPSAARAAEDARLIAARVAEGFARAGLIELPPAPFSPGCGD